MLALFPRSAVWTLVVLVVAPRVPGVAYALTSIVSHLEGILLVGFATCISVLLEHALFRLYSGGASGVVYSSDGLVMRLDEHTTLRLTGLEALAKRTPPPVVPAALFAGAGADAGAGAGPHAPGTTAVRVVDSDEIKGMRAVCRSISRKGSGHAVVGEVALGSGEPAICVEQPVCTVAVGSPGEQVTLRCPFTVGQVVRAGDQTALGPEVLGVLDASARLYKPMLGAHVHAMLCDDSLTSDFDTEATLRTADGAVRRVQNVVVDPHGPFQVCVRSSGALSTGVGVLAGTFAATSDPDHSMLVRVTGASDVAEDEIVLGREMLCASGVAVAIRSDVGVCFRVRRGQVGLFERLPSAKQCLECAYELMPTRVVWCHCYAAHLEGAPPMTRGNARGLFGSSDTLFEAVRATLPRSTFLFRWSRFAQAHAVETANATVVTTALRVPLFVPSSVVRWTNLGSRGCPKHVCTNVECAGRQDAAQMLRKTVSRCKFDMTRIEPAPTVVDGLIGRVRQSVVGRRGLRK